MRAIICGGVGQPFFTTRIQAAHSYGSLSRSDRFLFLERELWFLKCVKVSLSQGVMNGAGLFPTVRKKNFLSSYLHDDRGNLIESTWKKESVFEKKKKIYLILSVFVLSPDVLRRKYLF